MLWIGGAVAFGQDLVGDRPAIVETTRTPKERDARESLHLYAYGLLCERENRLLEALEAFEAAAKLEPNAPMSHRAQVPMLILLERPRDALTAVKRVLELDPVDHEAWFLAARLHRSLGEMKEYRASLEKGLAVPKLAFNEPAIAQQLYLDLAQYLEMISSPTEAIAAYAAAAKILDRPDPILEQGAFSRAEILAKAAEVYAKIGQLHRDLKKFSEAEAAFRAAMSRHPTGNPHLNLQLAKLAVQQSKWPSALDYVDAYLRLQPQATEPYQIKIECLAKLNWRDKTLPWLEGAVVADPLNVNLKLILAGQYAEARQIVQAERLYKTLADDAPSEDVYRALFRLIKDGPAGAGTRILVLFDKAVTLASKDDPPQAGSIRASEQARAMFGVFRDDPVVARMLIDAAYKANHVPRSLAYETRYFLATLAEKHGKLEQAESFYRQALIEPNPANEPALFSGLFTVLLKQKKYAEIVTEAKRGLVEAKNTNLLTFHGFLAIAQARLGKLREAEEAADAGWKIADDRNRLYAASRKIGVLIQAEKLKEAEAFALELLEAVSLPKDVQEARHQLSNIYSAWKKPAKAEEQLRIILALDPNNVGANNDLGYFWADQGKHLPEAEAMIRKALELARKQRKTGPDEDLDNPAFVDSLGWVLFRRGQFEEARKQLERAVALPNGDEPTLWDHLGDVYFRIARLVQAQSAYERSVELFEVNRTRAKDAVFRDVRRKLDLVKTQVRAK